MTQTDENQREPVRLADHIPFEPTSARIESQWSHVRDRLDAQPSPLVGGGLARGWWKLALGGLTMAAAVAIGILAYRATTSEPPDRVAFDGASLESGADEVEVGLRDGTAIVLEPYAQVEVARQDPREVRLRVSRGRARFAVPHVDGRSFVVSSHDVDVIVVGTRFSVALVDGSGGQQQVAVRVEEGTVEVRRADETPRRVHTGEELRLDVAGTEARASAEPIAPPTEDEAVDESAPDHPRRHAHRPDPSELWDRASEARRAGRAAEAADLYETFLRVAPRDSQAALAAFQLARLRMDNLDDPSGAIAPLRRALSMAPRAPFAEDAMARLVDATSRAGRTGECHEARERYLSRYPEGVHRARVEARCP
ncbi:MAG: FecR domain-containing protein [Sandaracinaceae bacterium]